jgi:hypothetical protein
MAFMNNYSMSFQWWDRLLRMDNKYQVYHLQICTATKGLDDVQHKAIEEKMVLEEEEAGFTTEKEVECQAEGKKNQSVSQSGSLMDHPLEQTRISLAT